MKNCKTNKRTYDENVEYFLVALMKVTNVFIMSEIRSKRDHTASWQFRSNKEKEKEKTVPGFPLTSPDSFLGALEGSKCRNVRVGSVSACPSPHCRRAGFGGGHTLRLHIAGWREL